MPDFNGPDKEPKEKRQFIREKIVKQPMTRKQIAQRILVLLFIAVLCGGAAGISFAVAKPFAERYLAPETTQESPQITIPKDEPETTVAATEPESTKETETETEPIEEIVQSVIKRYEHTTNDLTGLFNTLRAASQEADKGIVVVHSVKQEVDWFDNPVESAGLYAGIVIASTPSELLILTPEAAVENADSIKVTFSDNAEVSGTIKQSDTISGMAIVSADVSQMEESTKKMVSALKLGNSYSARQGDIVMALGAPAGMVHSASYGFITYVARNVQVPDGTTRLFYTDVKGNAGAGTFLLNTAGEVIGWVTDQYKTEDTEDMTVVMAISDYKAALEKMTNGIAVPYLGIKGQEVTAAMAEDGLPLGVYVSDSIAEGPAYSTGIQNGDVIVKIGDAEIVTMKDFQSQVENIAKDEVVIVTIQRKGIEEYKELEYEVTVGAR